MLIFIWNGPRWHEIENPYRIHITLHNTTKYHIHIIAKKKKLTNFLQHNSPDYLHHRVLIPKIYLNNKCSSYRKKKILVEYKKDYVGGSQMPKGFRIWLMMPWVRYSYAKIKYSQGIHYRYIDSSSANENVTVECWLTNQNSHCLL